MGQVNVISVTNLVYFISDLLMKRSNNVLAISETWLLPTVALSFIDIANYSSVWGDTDIAARCHRSLLVSV